MHSIHLLTAILLLATLLLTLSPPLAAGQADDQACATSGPRTGDYEVTVCLSISWTGELNTGNASIAASIEATEGDLPAITEVEFSLAKAPSAKSFDILTDYAPPYGLTLPTSAYADGNYRLGLAIEFTDRFETTHPELNVIFANGQSADPKVTDSWRPTSGQPGSPFVVAAVGDGAGGLPGADAVADMIEDWNPNMLLYLGDVYNFGTYPEFYNYYEPTLGKLKGITNPVIGNHEAGGSGFQGFFEYWDTHRHYYSVDAAGWHFVGIDNTDTYQQLNPGDPQYEWLAEDLRTHASDCTIVFMHHPRFGLTHSTENVAMQALWQLLVQNDVELALTGHEHNYQRWKPLDESGDVDSDGVTQIVVGTGGHELESFKHSDSRAAVAIEDRDGALRMVLTPDGADYQFIATDGSVLDSGSIPCSVPGAVTLSRSKSKPGGAVDADLVHFEPDSAVTLTWDDGTILGEGRTDDDGSARVTFLTPSAALGTYGVTVTDEAGLAGTAQLSVIPRVDVTQDSVPAGSGVRVNLDGYQAESTVEIRFSGGDGTQYVVLGTADMDEYGGASVVVAIPARVWPGAYRLIGVPTSRDHGSASVSIRVTLPGTSPGATPVDT